MYIYYIYIKYIIIIIIGILKGWFRFGSGMSYIIMAEIAVFGLLNLIALWFFTKFLLKGLVNRINQLDLTLAEAIKSVVEGNFELPDQVNPMQSFLMEMIKDNFTKKNNVEVLTRDDQGKFA